MTPLLVSGISTMSDGAHGLVSAFASLAGIQAISAFMENSKILQTGLSSCLQPKDGISRAWKACLHRRSTLQVWHP